MPQVDSPTLRRGPLWTRCGWGGAVGWFCGWALALGGIPNALASQQVDPAAGAQCSNGQITTIFFDRHSVFDVDPFREGGAVAWTLRLANRLHVTTRESFLRRELLFRRGDCFDPFLVAESGRLLRAYGFLSRVDVYAVEQPDGSQHVVVDTQDDWTTKVDVSASLDEGFRFEGIDVTEENFLGRGMELGVQYQTRREVRDLGFTFRTTRLFQSRWDALVSAGNTRVGDFYTMELAYPFLGESGKRAAIFTWTGRDDSFSYSLQSGDPYSNLLLPFTHERMVAAGAIRRGEPGNLTLLGAGVTRETAFSRNLATEAQLITEGRFAEGEPVDSARLTALGGQVLDLWRTRLNLMVGWRGVAFDPRRQLDALQGVQDVQTGTEFTLTVGATPGMLGVGGPGGTRDLFGLLTFFRGSSTPQLVFNTSTRLEGRRELSGPRSGEWRDLMAEVDAHMYWQPQLIPNHTLMARVAASGGWSMDRPYQLTLGGRDAVRGFETDAFPGGRRIVLTVEERAYFRWPKPDAFDLGTTVFADLGRIWPGDAPFGLDSGLQASVGAGLRIGFPSGTRRAVRLDLAFPVSGGRTFRDVVFRVSMRDWVGIMRGVTDGQLARSRWGGLSPLELVR